jgi:hypothetical protein
MCVLPPEEMSVAWKAQWGLICRLAGQLKQQDFDIIIANFK